MERILAAAVADAQQRKATFSRYELTRTVNRYLPDFLGGLSGEQVTRLLEKPDRGGAAARRPVRHCAADRAGDGAGAGGLPAHRWAEPWRRHGAEIYTTCAMLDTETRLLRAGAQTGAPKVAPERAASALGADRARVEARLWREDGHVGAPGAADARGGAGDTPGGAESALSSAGLTDDQAQAAYGVLTSGRAIDILIGPAGTGKREPSQPSLRHSGRLASVG